MGSACKLIFPPPNPWPLDLGAATLEVWVLRPSLPEPLGLTEPSVCKSGSATSKECALLLGELMWLLWHGVGSEVLFMRLQTWWHNFQCYRNSQAPGRTVAPVCGAPATGLTLCFKASSAHAETGSGRISDLPGASQLGSPGGEI